MTLTRSLAISALTAHMLTASLCCCWSLQQSPRQTAWPLQSYIGRKVDRSRQEMRARGAGEHMVTQRFISIDKHEILSCTHTRKPSLLGSAVALCYFLL
ncbi:hypothetical protein C8Q74DRAFT_1233020 [Fomes fomentarius]|nr:hypothetical protein C8Q74DRAFT_1233020 [Fomes fomentarius]